MVGLDQPAPLLDRGRRQAQRQPPHRTIGQGHPNMDHMLAHQWDDLGGDAVRAADPPQQRLGRRDAGLVVAGAADTPIGIVAGRRRLAQVVAERGEDQGGALLAFQAVALGDHSGSVAHVQ